MSTIDPVLIKTVGMLRSQNIPNDEIKRRLNLDTATFDAIMFHFIKAGTSESAAPSLIDGLGIKLSEAMGIGDRDA